MNGLNLVTFEKVHELNKTKAKVHGLKLYYYMIWCYYYFIFFKQCSFGYQMKSIKKEGRMMLCERLCLFSRERVCERVYVFAFFSLLVYALLCGSGWTSPISKSGP